MSEPRPHTEFQTIVLPEWIDHNGHMATKNYTAVFHLACADFYGILGLGQQNLETAGSTIFALQECVWFKREVVLGDPLRATSQLIDFDHNKVVTFHHLYQSRDNYVAAMYELIEIHMDTKTRQPAPFPPDIVDRLGGVLALHQKLERPPMSGQGIGIPRGAG